MIESGIRQQISSSTFAASKELVLVVKEVLHSLLISSLWIQWYELIEIIFQELFDFL